MWTRLEALVQLRIAFGCPFTDEVWRGLTSLKALAVLICRYSTDTANKALGASTVSLGAFGAGPTPHTQMPVHGVKGLLAGMRTA